MWRFIEAESVSLGVLSYGISLTTLEEVFLNLAAQEEIKPPQADDPNSPTSGNAANATSGRSTSSSMDDGKASYGSVAGKHGKEEHAKLIPVHVIHFSSCHLRLH
jgi:hypothetical protein